VIDEYLHDRRLVGRSVPRERRQQHLLLDAEVFPSIGQPERQERVTRLRRRLLRRAAQSLGDHEPVMVIARERREGFTALHGSNARTAAGLVALGEAEQPVEWWPGSVRNRGVPALRPRAAVEQYADQLAGKVVVDITNPVNETFDGLVVPPDGSATQELATIAGDARMVKAFNTTFAGT
jgi:hypothetical protein